MPEQTYAVVVYLSGPLARLVDDLRTALNPQFAGKAAHVTVLPPRPLIISEEAAVEEARAQCSEWEPFELEVGGVQTFFPITGVAYLEMARGVEKMVCLHEALNRGFLARQEPYPYIPHITISQEMDERRTFEVIAHVSQAWQRYSGSRVIPVETLVFVRQAPAGDWVDLADLQLGRAHVPAQ